jgi:hypothetical protein
MPQQMQLQILTFAPIPQVQTIAAACKPAEESPDNTEQLST